MSGNNKTAKRGMKRAMTLQAVVDAGAAMGLYVAVAEQHGLTERVVKGVVESVMRVASGNLKTNGSFKLGGSIKLTLKTKKDEGGDHGETIGAWILHDQ